MFRDRAFNISFLISLFWHIFWIGVVAIITVPTGMSLADYTKVSFLGPLLEETAFELMLDESNSRIETIYRKPIVPRSTFDVEIQSMAGRAFKHVSGAMQPIVFKSPPRDIIRESKRTMPYIFNKASSLFGNADEIKSDFKSPIKKRPCVFKPDKIPVIPLSIAGNKKSFRIQLQFTVTPSGGVKGVEPVVSSGHPKVDMIGMDYLKKWCFVPLLPSEKQEDSVEMVELELMVD